MPLLLPIVLLIAILPEPVQAYIGPGLGVGAVAAFVGAVLAGILALVGFVWYPVKRILRKRRQKREQAAAAAMTQAAGPRDESEVGGAHSGTIDKAGNHAER